MKRPRIRTFFLAPLVLFALFYVALAVFLLVDDNAVAPLATPLAKYDTVAIFGASGTAGDGILKAALANADIGEIHVITRRATPRIEAGVASGKVKMTMHQDYLDYSALHAQLAKLDAVYWAIGTSSVGLDEKTYGRIHVDFPVQFVRQWLALSDKAETSFHYISSSDISADSRMMWAREKVRAENTLFEIAEGSRLRVIAYRPDYIGPTKEEANLGQNLLYWFFAPVGSAVRATQIGQAMFEVTARGSEFANGDRLGTRSIIRYSDAYESRCSLVSGVLP
ncbi:MAG TPA: hypothetical protein PKK10_10755 [Woeseiaceae bacterium]|nr:hypothetical protein [Woeseiaceae bacterium]